MKAKSISDQKRVVRGEHWLFARTILRARDKVHHPKLNVLMVAGPSPSEEINCIKELMPKARITAVDVDDNNVAAAKLAGADHALNHDLNESIWIELKKKADKRGRNRISIEIPSPKLGHEPFDAVCLDLTGPANGTLAKLTRIYLNSLAKRGVLIVTFSYGRDVVEVFTEDWLRKTSCDTWKSECDFYERIQMPESIKPRIAYLLDRNAFFLRSILQYRGGSMPMVSLLLVNELRDTSGRGRPAPSFKSIAGDDFETAILLGDIGRIYSCPSERIEALRRSAIAKKAVATRKRRLAETRP